MITITSEAILLTALLTVSEGDKVVMMTPNYLSFNGIAESLGADVDYVPLLKKDSWRWDIDYLKEVVVDETKVISICNPNNPTGSVLTVAEMEKIVEIAETFDVFIHSDEVYIGAELSNRQTVSFQNMYENSNKW